MLAKWFGLSGPQLEECLRDRLWFRRFVGLSLTDATPDETTFVRFRARLREAGLQARGVTCAIAFKRNKGRPDLPPMQKKLNRLIARVRAVVEHPFAWMKAMGYRRVRYRGRRRNEAGFALTLIAYNWKRSLSLVTTKAG